MGAENGDGSRFHKRGLGAPKKPFLWKRLPSPFSLAHARPPFACEVEPVRHHTPPRGSRNRPVPQKKGCGNFFGHAVLGCHPDRPKGVEGSRRGRSAFWQGEISPLGHPGDLGRNDKIGAVPGKNECQKILAHPKKREAPAVRARRFLHPTPAWGGRNGLPARRYLVSPHRPPRRPLSAGPCDGVPSPAARVNKNGGQGAA